MLTWSLKELDLELKLYPSQKLSPTPNIDHEQLDPSVRKFLIVELKDMNFEAFGEVAYSARFQEDPDTIKQKFEEFKEQYPQNTGSVSELKSFVDKIDLPNSLKAGIEMAFLNFLSLMSNKPVSELLGLEMVSMVKSSFTLPRMEIGKINDAIIKNNLNRFHALRIKSGMECSKEIIKEVKKNFKGLIRIDGMEDWPDPDEVIKFVEQFNKNGIIEYIEQPMPFDYHDQYLYLKKNIETMIIADESLVAGEVSNYFQERFHGVKVKLLKSGGVLNALQQAAMAKGHGLKAVLGCALETSVGVYGAMSIASAFDVLDLDGFFNIKEEPYRQVFEENGKLFSHFLH